MKKKLTLATLMMAATLVANSQGVNKKEIERLDSIATERFLNENYSSALDMTDKTIEIIEKAKDSSLDSLYIKSMLIAGKCYYRQKKFNEAADMAKKYTNFYGSHFSSNDSTYAFYADNTALYLNAAERNEEAEEFSNRAIDIFERTMPNSQDLAVAYIHAAEMNGENNPKKAVEQQLKGLAIMATIVESKYTQEYCDELKYLQVYYEKAKMTKEAEETSRKVKWLEEGRLPKLPINVKDAEEAHMRKEEALYCSRYIMEHKVSANGMNNAIKFITSWVTVCKDVSVDIGRFLTQTITETHDAIYYAVYFASATNHLITFNKRYMDYDAYQYAVIGVLNFYMQNRDILTYKNKNLDKYINTYEEDEKKRLT